MRDLDAHSWVEAYFPSYGWVTFDPTPAIAPPRAQAPGHRRAGRDAEDEEDDERRAPRAATAQSDRGRDRRRRGRRPAAAARRSCCSIARASCSRVAAARWPSRSSARRRRYATLGPDAAVAELERALRRSGRRPAPALTLRRLEDSLRVGARRRGVRRRAARGALRLRRRRRPRAPSAARCAASSAPASGSAGALRGFWALPPW